MHSYILSKSNLIIFSVLLAACGGSNNEEIIEVPDPIEQESSWLVSNCNNVTGTPYIALTTNNATSLIEDGPANIPTNSIFTNGLVSAGPNTLFVAINEQLLFSQDTGCNWTVIENFTAQPLIKLAKVNDSSIYAYTNEDTTFYRIFLDNSIATITSYEAPGLIKAFQVDVNNDLSLKIATGNDHNIYQSNDGGISFTSSGTIIHGVTTYFTTFDANNLNHIIRGTTRLTGSTNNAGVWTSFDAGNSWTQGTGFGTSPINNFTGSISTTNADITWILGLDIDNNELSRRKIYRSADGGQTYEMVLSADIDMTLYNGTPIFIDPSNADRITFSLWDPTLVSDRQSHLYIYNYQEDSLEINSFAYENLGEVRVIEFNPEHPENLMFGISHSIE